MSGNIHTILSEGKPHFIEESLIKNVLSKFVDKIQRKSTRLSIKVKDNNDFSELFDFNNTENIDYLWSCLDSLKKDYGVLNIDLDRKIKSYEPIYLGARLTFMPEKEELVRLWLNKPVIDPEVIKWKNAIQKYHDCFEDFGAALIEKSPIAVNGKTSLQVISGFAKMQKYLKNHVSVRELSAKCFWGDSKFLDKKKELILRLYPNACQNIVKRPLLFNVYLPRVINAVLFIENHDSFLQMVQCSPKKTALIYSAGFRGAASRSRGEGASAFSYLNNDLSAEMVQGFQRFWYEGSDSIKVFFWGDLDFSGLGILASLRKVFPNTNAWEPGYLPMIKLAKNGVCHNAELAGKEKQKDPGITGCQFADEVLRPLIMGGKSFVDQEACFPEKNIIMFL